MKIIRNKLIGLGTILALAFALNVHAARDSAGAQPSLTAKPITTTKEAEEVKPGDTVMMSCGACKTVMLSEFKSAQGNGRATPQWMEIGSKHECAHCGGEITVVKGKTKDSMQHNCSKCGEGAAFCCAISPAEEKK